MSEHRTETTTAGTVLVLVMLLGGLALLCIVVVVALGFLASRTTLDRGMEAAMLEREEAMRQQQRMAGLMAQQARDAEAARRQQAFGDPEVAPDQPAKALDPAQLQQALDVANKYLEHMKAKRFKEAEGLLTPDYLGVTQGPGMPSLTEGALPTTTTTLTGVQANPHSFRFRYRGQCPDVLTTNWYITIVPVSDGFRISSVQSEDMVGAGGLPIGGPGAPGLPPP